MCFTEISSLVVEPLEAYISEQPRALLQHQAPVKWHRLEFTKYIAVV